MTDASDTTPCNGENVSGESFDYQKVAETLLQHELERHGFRVREAFHTTSGKLQAGESLDRDDWTELKNSLEQAQILVEAIGDGFAVQDDDVQLVEDDGEAVDDG